MTIGKINNHFWTNYNAIFGGVGAQKYSCSKCGALDYSDVIEEVVVDYFPMGDQLVERREIKPSCLKCGTDVDSLE